MTAGHFGPGNGQTNDVHELSRLLINGSGHDDQLTLRELALRLWHGKRVVFLSMLAVVLAVVVWMKVESPVYTATVVVAPASDGGAGGMASRLSQYSGIAALAGIDLPANEMVTPFTQFAEVMTSPVVAERLIKRHDVLTKAFEGVWKWDPETKSWTRRAGLLAPVKRGVRAFFDLPQRRSPSAVTLASYLEEKLSISLVQTTGMQRIEFRHKDPVFAVSLLRWIHKEGDDLIREEAAARTSRQIAYIESKLRTTTAADHRRSLVQLLLDQEKQMMMIQVDLPFAARIIEPPIASDQPTFPKPILFLALAIVSGAMMGVFIVFLMDALRGGNVRSPAIEIDPTARTAAAATNGAAPPVEMTDDGIGPADGAHQG